MPPPRIQRPLPHLLSLPRQTSLPRPCPLPMLCPTRSYAAPSPRARKSGADPPPLTTAQIFGRYNTKTFPMDSFMSAYNSKAIPVTPTLALNIIRRYAELRGDIDPSLKGRVEHGKTLCEEFKISPKTLTLLGITLHQSTPPASVLRPTATHLITLADELGDPSATIALYHRANISPLPPGSQAARAAAREAMIQGYLNRIERAAKVEGDPACAFIWGEYLSHRGGLDGGRREEARGWLRTAGEKGVAEAWLRLGEMCVEDASAVEQKWERRVEWEVRLMERDKEGKVRERNVRATKGGKEGESAEPPNARGNSNTPSPEKVRQLLEEAKEALEKACEGDLPDAHFQLALLLAASKSASVESFSPSAASIASTSATEEEEDELPDPHPSSPPPPPPPPELTQKYIHHLTKAAASGNVHAMYYLGSYYLHHHQDGLPGVSKLGVSRLGRQWIQAAAHGGHAKAMKAFGEILESEGKAEMGKEWKNAGEWQEVVGGVNRER
ncbi:hypothetical protein EV426DRAFT_593592 [Tirmania nivea]|nr:hypothetical protein EV426DRAFT_593592 [Tirmania nivea]